MWVTLLWDQCLTSNMLTYIRVWGHGLSLAERQNNTYLSEKEKKETGCLWRMKVWLLCFLFSLLSTHGSPHTHIYIDWCTVYMHIHRLTCAWYIHNITQSSTSYQIYVLSKALLLEQVTEFMCNWITAPLFQSETHLKKRLMPELWREPYCLNVVINVIICQRIKMEDGRQTISSVILFKDYKSENQPQQLLYIRKNWSNKYNAVKSSFNTVSTVESIEKTLVSTHLTAMSVIV